MISIAVSASDLFQRILALPSQWQLLFSIWAQPINYVFYAMPLCLWQQLIHEYPCADAADGDENEGDDLASGCGGHEQEDL